MLAGGGKRNLCLRVIAQYARQFNARIAGRTYDANPNHGTLLFWSIRYAMNALGAVCPAICDLTVSGKEARAQ
jgi:hypothetical protein